MNDLNLNNGGGGDGGGGGGGTCGFSQDVLNATISNNNSRFILLT